jgi:anti-sigma regulatory factor (Ser/Thr protein kinase)
MLVDQPFTESDLPALRRTVAAHADRTALPPEKVRDLILIVSELASNAVRHGGGGGRLRLWATPEAVTCEISDAGPGLPSADQLPRQRPEPTVSGGRGLWLTDQFADTLVLADADGGGTVATASLRLG